MKDLEIFLNNPNLFYSSLSNNLTIGVTRCDRSGTNDPFYRGQGNKVPNGVLLHWCAPQSKTDQGQRWRRASECPAVLRTITDYERQSLGNGGTKHTIRIGEQKKVNAPNVMGYSSQRTTEADFGRIVLTDALNQAYLDNVPGLLEQFTDFVNATKNNWLENADGSTPHNGHVTARIGQIYLVDVTDQITKEVATNTNQSIADCSYMLRSPIKEWELKTPTLVGLDEPDSEPHVYRSRKESDGAYLPGRTPDRYLLPVRTTGPMTIKSYKNKPQKNDEIGNEPITVANLNSFSYMSNFKVVLEGPSASIKPDCDIRIYAAFKWQREHYVPSAKIVKKRNRFGTQKATKQVEKEKNTMYLPVISGLVLNIDSEGLLNENISVKLIERAKDRTKNRAVKGGYRGGYQGIETLSFGDRCIIKHHSVAGLQAFAKGPPIRSFELTGDKRIPLSLEQYMKIERPQVDIKPIEIGHLRLYRLTNPPKRQVTAEILSDLLLPSMPALLIATDTDIRVTSIDEQYIDGQNCSGNCAKEETVEVTVPPGLYLVDRQIKCALGHDPGRSEYISGFGDNCNEVITIRRMLAQLNVFYDQYRGNMIGTTKSDTLNSMDDTDNSSFLGRLG